MKRTLDFLLSLIGLLLTSPILLPVIFLVWIQDWHSPFYIAPRVGRREKMFKMVKLRSMIINADKSGVDSTSSNDRRITGVGRFIRKYKLDELSQLWNVLIGDMSLVGPRPEQPYFVEKYSAILPYYYRRHKVRPGITGWWQVKYKPFMESVEEMQSRLLDDFYYIENISLKLDIEILVRTVYCVVSGHGQT